MLPPKYIPVCVENTMSHSARNLQRVYSMKPSLAANLTPVPQMPVLTFSTPRHPGRYPIANRSESASTTYRRTCVAFPENRNANVARKHPTNETGQVRIAAVRSMATAEKQLAAADHRTGSGTSSLVDHLPPVVRNLNPIANV
jgi:hypothetical protein